MSFFIYANYHKSNFVMRVRKVIIKNTLSKKPPKGCVICFPGLGIPGFMMLKFARHMQLRRTTMAAIEPYKLIWYPRPNGPKDQSRTIMGLPYAVRAAYESVEKVKKFTGFDNEQIVLLGFSAGSVIALQLAMQTEKPFAACVSLAGAIFEPNKVIKAKTNTPIILQHNKHDDCFDWFERYLPMRQALLTNGYNLKLLERPYGQHTMYVDDAINVSRQIAPLLGYPKNFADKYLNKKTS